MFTIASASIKSIYQWEGWGCKSQVADAPKRQTVGSPEAAEFNNSHPEYVPGAESEGEDDAMCQPWDDLQLSPGYPISISDDDCDKEQDPSLGLCTAKLARMSLGTGGDAPACIEAKKKEAPAKRTVKHARRTRKECILCRTYRWVENCFHKKEVPDPRARLKKHPKLIAIWATCTLCLYKNPKAKVYGVKTKITHCPSWTICVKHVENTQCLHTPEEIDEAVTNPKAH